MTAPRVSVVVPVRNRRELLRRLLDALAQQTLTDHEVVVVDDDSSDGSGEEAERDAARGRPVRLVRNRLPGGAGALGGGAVAARRAGVAAARAELLAFTDSDCVPCPGWLAAGVEALEGGADLVQGRTIPQRWARPLERTLTVEREDGLYATCNVFYRRQAYEAAGGFDPDASRRLGFRPGAALAGLGFGEDTLLGWRVRRTPGARTAFAPDALVSHHVFAADATESLRRAWQTGGFPALVREVPELRDTLLVDRYLAGGRSRLLLYLGALGWATAPFRSAHRWSAGLCPLALWGLARAESLRRGEPSWRRRLRVLPVDLAAEAVTAAALVGGSLRSRTVVL